MFMLGSAPNETEKKKVVGRKLIRLLEELAQVWVPNRPKISPLWDPYRTD